MVAISFVEYLLVSAVSGFPKSFSTEIREQRTPCTNEGLRLVSVQILEVWFGGHRPLQIISPLTPVRRQALIIQIDRCVVVNHLLSALFIKGLAAARKAVRQPPGDRFCWHADRI